MNKNILSVMKKEFARFFRDPRMVLTALILPGAMVFILYTFMGTALQNALQPDETHIPVLNAVDMPADIKALAESYGFQVKDATSAKAVKEQIAAKENDVLIVFEHDFSVKSESYEPASGLDAPNVEVYYNTTNPDSEKAYRLAQQMLTDYEDSRINLFDVNRDIEGDMASQEDLMAFSFSSMLPFLLLIFMFSSCLSIAPESIAGEKERGTIATILVTPIKRSELAVGKILSLGVLAFLGGLSSAIGMFLSLPQMMSLSGEDMNANIYTLSDYAIILLLILSSVLFIVTVISIISAFSKSVKEANTTAAPFMAVAMLVGITAMFGGKAPVALTAYLIPLYNSVQAMSAVLKFDYGIAPVAVAVISNIIYACAGSFVLTRMFNSERIIFSR